MSGAAGKIWLDAVCDDCSDACYYGDITWSDDKAQGNCEKCGKEPVPFLRARPGDLPDRMAEALRIAQTALKRIYSAAQSMEAGEENPVECAQDIQRAVWNAMASDATRFRWSHVEADGFQGIPALAEYDALREKGDG